MTFLKLIIISVFISSTSFAIPKLDHLIRRLDLENRDIRASVHDINDKDSKLKQEEAWYYPHVFLGGNAKQRSKNEEEQKQDEKSDDDKTDEEKETEDEEKNDDGTWKKQKTWGFDVTLSYEFFSRLRNWRRVQTARYEKLKTIVDSKIRRLERRSQLIQLLLEYQWLHSLEGPIEEAKSLIDEVKSFSKKRSDILYLNRDRAELDERQAEVHYNFVKIKEGLVFVRQAMLDLIPSLSKEELKGLPTFAINYEIPDPDALRERFHLQSYSRQKLNYDIQKANDGYTAALTQRPWVPNLTFNGSVSRGGDFSGSKPRNQWSLSLEARFPIFDGMLEANRRREAYSQLVSASEAIRNESSKRIVYIAQRRMKAYVAKAKFEHKLAHAKILEVQKEDAKGNQKRGISTPLELSATSLEYTKARLEAFEDLKNYHQALMDIVIELNDWEKVKFNEKTSL